MACAEVNIVARCPTPKLNVFNMTLFSYTHMKKSHIGVYRLLHGLVPSRINSNNLGNRWSVITVAESEFSRNEGLKVQCVRC